MDHEVHNRLAPAVLRQIVQETIVERADHELAIVVLESVVTGVLTMIIKTGGDNRVLDLFVENVRERMAKIRLEHLDPAGSA